MDKIAEQLGDKYTSEQLIELMGFLWTDYVEIDRNRVHEFLGQFGPELRDEFVQHVKGFEE